MVIYNHDDNGVQVTLFSNDQLGVDNRSILTLGKFDWRIMSYPLMIQHQPTSFEMLMMKL